MMVSFKQLIFVVGGIFTCLTGSDGQQAIDVFDPVPPGPYIRFDQSSQLVTIPRPPPPTDASLLPSNCPHDGTGLKRWYDTRTWRWRSIPRRGQNVVLPRSSRVLIDKTVVESLGVITIPVGSQLIIGSNVAGINITARGFQVDGSLVAGSTTCRISTPITITLTGARPATATTITPPVTYKGISVTGQIQLHGRRYYHTWTRLSKSVEVGQSVLLLQEKVNWVKGQQIVLVTSAIKCSRDYNQNEVLTVREVSTNSPDGVGSVVHVMEKVKYRHIANMYYQVEVGLLTRTIKIQGSAKDSEPTDKDPLTCRDSLADYDWTIYKNTSRPCTDKQITGFGGHVRVSGVGIGQIEGVEFYRMGQTNVLGRYPFHFHLLGNCPTCYIRDSSFHRSFYRCIAIHGTNNATISENVAFDVVGYCYYLEDGVEERNTISYNLAAYIHTIGPDIPRGWAQQTEFIYTESPTLRLPADVTASGFYITNVFNYIIGNAASGGWSGFALPSLPTGLHTFRDSGYRPLLKESLVFDGNTAHSTGWWWYHSGAIYIGGTLYHNDQGLLEYNPGRNNEGNRNPCKVDPCLAPYYYCDGCPENGQAWLKISNSKTFLTAGVGLNSWTGRIELSGFESHDSRLAVEALSEGFWMDQALVVCRTGESLSMPSNNAYSLEASGFFWYDVYQEHIITRATFRNCGLRSDDYDQYDTAPDRGCSPDDPQMGCRDDSTVFGFLTHSDQFTPQIMQGTKQISFSNCGRRFKFTMDDRDTVSGRGQNWLDADGTVSGLNEPALIGSGLKNASNWWAVDDDTLWDYQAPLVITKVSGGPRRDIGYVRIEWDESLHNQVGWQLCGNGDQLPCPPEGYVRHAGPKFSPFKNSSVNKGLPLTARGDVVGPTGGYGWIVTFNNGSPRSVKFSDAEIKPNSPMLISMIYPPGTIFTITAHSVEWCWEEDTYKCDTTFRQVATIGEVTSGSGDTYHFTNDGILTFRMAETGMLYTGNPSFTLPTLSTPSRRLDVDTFALYRFERMGVVLPRIHWGQKYTVQAICPGDTASSPTDGYCSQTVSSNYDPLVCPSTSYVQVAYDKCCLKSNRAQCVFADKSKNF